MKISKYELVKHIMLMIGITAILSLGMVYPFLSGAYDRLAMPLSILIQTFGLIGVLLSMVGLGGLIMPKNYRAYTAVILYLSTCIVILLAFFAFLSAGKAFGIILIAFWLLVFRHWKATLNHTKENYRTIFPIVSIYLVAIPLFVLIIQLAVAKPVTQWSRNKAIKNAGEFIRHLENFRSKQGYYPKSLQAMYKDYDPQIAGIEKYYYLPFGDSYNISFEQPRFLLDVIGTREWIVYNPKDEHRVYSHTSWFLLLSPQELQNSQGWYASGETTHAHWKYFLFD